MEYTKLNLLPANNSAIVNTIVLVACLITLASCNITRVIKPLEKDEVQVSASLGGPLIEFAGAPMPIPLTSVHAAYGLSEKQTIMGGLHTTALAFGVLQLDLGTNFRLYVNNAQNTGISASLIANTMIDRWESNASLYPQADVNVWRKYGNQLFYANLSSWLELRNTRAHNEIQPNRLLPSMGLGYQWLKEKYGFQAELKYIAPHLSNRDIVVNYIAPGHRGALGLYMGIIKKF